MDSDINLARSTVDHLNRFDMRIELFPLAAPVGTNLFFPDYTPAFRCLGPTDALPHQRQRTIDIPLVESRVDLGYERLCVCHIVLRVDDHSAWMNIIGPEKRACFYISRHLPSGRQYVSKVELVVDPAMSRVCSNGKFIVLRAGL